MKACQSLLRVLGAFASVLLLVACSDDSTYPPVDSDTQVVGSVELQRESFVGVWQNRLTRDCQERYDFGRDNKVRIFSAREELLANYIVLRDPDARDQILFEIISDNGGQDCLDDVRDSTGVFQGPFFIEFNAGGVDFFHTSKGIRPFMTLTYVAQQIASNTSDDYLMSFVSLLPDIAFSNIYEQFTGVIDVNFKKPTTVKVGLNDYYRDTYEILFEASYDEPYSGEISFTIDGLPYNWGPGNSYAIKAWVENATGSEQASIIRSIPLLND